MNDFSKPTVATNAEFTSLGGDVLLIANGAETLHIITGTTGPSLLFPNTDAPAIALAILKAAGFAPSGNPDPSGVRGCVETAAGHLDDAILIAAGEAAQRELTRRRASLLDEHGIHGPYDMAITPVKVLIDTIIALQDEATR